MKYYAAVVSKEEAEACLVTPPFQVLASYHYFKKKKELVKEWVQSGYDVFMDSGAFSAENSGGSINIDDYCKFIIDTKVPVYAGLDVIGNALATMKNIHYMEQQYKLTPIPTFHIGGNPNDLHALFGYPYIALGGLVKSPGRERYCDQIWSMILKEAPAMRVHGFGMTNVDLMERYPWYSVDSSTYKDGRRFGRPKILWDDFKMIQITEEEFEVLLVKMGYKMEGISNADRLFLYDFHGANAYKIFSSHLKEVNKTKDFSYLTAQQKLI